MTHPSSQRGADALIQSLQAAGVRRIFTLSGNHIMPVFDAAYGSGIELVHTRHEASAVHMADAWSRITGQVGIALVTGGPGHANAVAALYTAQMAEAPIVLLSGHAPNDQIGQGAFQEMRQAEMAAPVCKAAWVCAHADDVAADVAKAIRLALSGRPGPVHLSLPTDVLEAATSAGVPEAGAFSAEPVPLDAAVAAELVQCLMQAKHPMVLVGPACMTRAARALTDALEQATGVPVIGMESPRGVGDASLGAFAQLLARVDCLVLVGKRLDFTLKFGTAFPAAVQVHQVDAEAAEIERSRRALGELQVTAQADAWSALRALTQQAQAAHEPSTSAWLTEARSAIDYRPAAWDHATSRLPGRLHPVQMLRPLQAVLDSHPESVLVCDGGEIGQWAMACLRAPHRVNNGVAGAIGAGLPYALAARFARPEAPVVAVMGDGTVGFHIAEFDTAVRHGLHFVVVVGNDARWNAEYQIQLRDYGAERLVGCELRPLRYDTVAQAFGAHGEGVTDAAALPQAVQRALASRLPACVNVMIEGVPAPLIKH
ncbi:thiamine pyrophosphate-binding protein [Variovorax sp. J22G73]|uniref:thiamine pyrophosphate-binding protein n=1 Tax=unclassified Variovorax TaxID=663243 RepID=UPI0025754ECF|nr:MULTISPECIES: thiamine pyrophosphate-binding protein [unclassified Variovorax]MDM0005816.1 thiamine pyrophosphate-binding protein [Variovorax sp. J22R203]MDM0099843.1 thiamine pyrophosphate-binding protein [Variovorax sp. J22G73]